MDTSFAVIELLPNSKVKVAAWAKHLSDHRLEALQSLRNEGVTVESTLVAELEGKDYLIIYMRALDMQKAHEAVKTSVLNVDAYHQGFKKACWGKRVAAQPVLDLSLLAEVEPDLSAEYGSGKGLWGNDPLQTIANLRGEWER